jgi:hypothetical protein
MASQTVTTTVNYDAASISGLLDGESITINGGSVTVNADVRWNQQAAVFGAVSISSSLGGSFLIDGTQVWEVPFSASTGNVPTQAALGSNGVTGGTSGATGELTRVWATGSLTPATAGGAMPATGYIKLRSRSGSFQAGETITLPGGATVTASSAGRRSWIHVVGRGSLTAAGSRLSIPRLGTHSITGDWYELGTTNGNDNQTFQYPVSDICPAIWIENSAGSGVYEIWLNAHTRWTDGAVATSDKRGMFFNCDGSTGVITIAARGANNAGLKPPTGCKVRIPNVILSSAEPGNYAVNIAPSSMTFRFGYQTPGGALNINYASCGWNVAGSSTYSVSMQNTGIAGATSFNTITATAVFRNVGVGLVVDMAGASPFSILNSYAGTTVEDVYIANNAVNSVAFAITDVAKYTVTGLKCISFGTTGTNAPGASARAIQATRLVDSTFTDCVAIGGIGFTLTPCTRVKVIGTKYASRSIGTTQTDAHFGVTITGGSDTVTVDGFSNFDSIANAHPYNGIVNIPNGNNIEIKNIGTSSTPYDGGSANQCAYLALLSTCLGVVMRRCYGTNLRLAMVSPASPAVGFEAYNCWGDAADVQINTCQNSTLRGGRYTPTTTGQFYVYGTHWMDGWTSTTAGFILLACNEPTAESLAQCTASLGVGSGFTASGNVAMKLLTDSVIWEMPYFALGVTGFANTAPTITGTSTANHTLQFQADTGSGWNGTWTALTGANLAAVAVNPAVGVKLRVRATVNTASTSNLLTYITLATTTTATDQQREYPLPGALLTVSGLVAGSRVKVTRLDTGALLAQDSTAGTSLTLDMAYTGAVRVEARNASGATTYRPWVTQVSIATGTTTTVTALQEQD